MSISRELLERLRADTPTVEHLIHFNNAGASLMPNCVWDAVEGHLKLERHIGGYEAAEQVQSKLDGFYESFAKLFNVEPSEIAYVENATRAWDMAFYSLRLQPGDRVITHASEYVSNYLAFLQLKERLGIEIDVAPSDISGQIDVESLPKLVNTKTKLITLSHIPTQGGLINPAEEVGKFAREYGLLYLLDACQSAGQLALDVKKLGCHMMSGTGRKFLRGPRGTGFLYVSNEIVDQLDPVFIDLHSATWTSPSDYQLAPGAKRFENWESFVAGRLGLAAAVEYALDIGPAAIEERVLSLAALLRDSLSQIKGILLHDLGQRKCGIVTFGKSNVDAKDLVNHLRANQINVNITSRSSAQLDFSARGLDDLVRASVHYFNTESEIEQFCSLVEAAR